MQAHQPLVRVPSAALQPSIQRLCHSSPLPPLRSCQHVAITSLFLATKAEETPCKLLDLFRAFDRVLSRRFCPPQPTASAASPYPSLYIHSPLFQHWRSVLAPLELTVLAALGYSLYLLQPHRVLPHLLNLLVPPSHPLLPSLLSSSIALLNSSHLLPLPLQFPPLTLALASIALSLERHRLSVPLDWVHLLGGDEDEVVRAAVAMAEVTQEGLGTVYVAVRTEGEEEDEVDKRRRDGEAAWAELRRWEAEAAAKRSAEESDERLMRELRRIAMEESLKSLRDA